MWDAEALRRRFASQAAGLDAYAKQCRSRATSENSYRMMGDRAAGEADVFGALSTSAAVETRATLMAKLCEMRDHPPSFGAASGISDHYGSAWVLTCEALIREFSQPDANAK